MNHEIHGSSRRCKNPHSSRPNNVVSAVLIVAASIGSVCSAAAEVTLVEVSGSDGRRTVLASGLAVAKDHVLTSFHAADGKSQISVRLSGSGAGLSATLVYADERAAVALLRVPGLDATAPIFSSTAPQAGQIVLTFADATAMSLDRPVRGAIGSITDLAGSGMQRRVLMFEHNAIVPAVAYGMPVLNECMEVLGVNRPDPKLSRSRIERGEDPRGRVFAVSLESVKTILAEQNVAVTVAEDTCLTSAERAALAEAQARAEAEAAARAALGEQAAKLLAEEAEEAARLQTEQTLLAEAAAEQARRSAETARQQATQLAAEAKTLADAAAATEEQKIQALELAEAARRAALDAETELADATAEADRQRVLLLETQQRAAQVEAQRLEAQILLRRTVAGGLIGLLVIVIAWAFMARRKRKQQRALSERAASAELAVQRMEATAIKPAPFACLLSGMDSNGQPFTLKIPAEALGNLNGVTIGRNPRNSSFLIDHDQISREHARLSVEARQLFVEDLGSTNGVKVDGVPVRSGDRSRVSHDSLLELGPLSLRVRLLPN